MFLGTFVSRNIISYVNVFLALTLTSMADVISHSVGYWQTAIHGRYTHAVNPRYRGCFFTLSLAPEAAVPSLSPHTGLAAAM